MAYGYPKQFPDYINLAANAEAEQAFPTEQPNLVGPPKGPFGLNGAGLDSAALAVLGALQNQPTPHNALGSFAQGLAGGLAGGRVRSMQSREAANAAEQKRVEREAEYRRRMVSDSARQMRGHQLGMIRDAAKEAAKKPAEPKDSLAYTDVTDNVNMQKRLVGMGYALPTANSKGRVMVPVDWLRPAPKTNANDPIKRQGSYNTIIDNVRVDPDVKDFPVIRDARNNATKAAKARNSAGDIMLMRYLAKVSDPTTGVREEEFKTFQSAQGTLSRYGVNLTTAMWGKGMLNDFGRKQLVEQLENIYQNKRNAYIGARTFYEDQARSVGIDPSRVIRNYDMEGDGVSPFDAVRKKNGRK